MERIILMRHAKAERRSESGEDFDRRLEPRGEADAQLMGSVMAEAGFVPTRALVSAAARTRQTWERASRAFPQASVRHDRGLYHADAGSLRRALQEEEAEPGVVMLVGHNPGLQDLALLLLVEAGESPSVQARVRDRFPTAAFIVFAMDVAGRPSFEGYFLPHEYGGGGGE